MPPPLLAWPARPAIPRRPRDHHPVNRRSIEIIYARRGVSSLSFTIVLLLTSCRVRRLLRRMSQRYSVLAPFGFSRHHPDPDSLNGLGGQVDSGPAGRVTPQVHRKSLPSGPVIHHSRSWCCPHPGGIWFPATFPSSLRCPAPALRTAMGHCSYSTGNGCPGRM